ncbi:hypothetical protein KR215_006906, partial [Drosophila sulfurigaster]
LRHAEPNGLEHNLWNKTKYLKRPTKRIPAILSSTGSWCRSNEEKSETFALHLPQTFTSFNLCSATDVINTQAFIESPCQMDLPIRAIQEDEVIGIVSSLKTTKSPGYDAIDAATLKCLPPSAIAFLTVIYNGIIRLHHFPSQWKCAEIIMIPKPGKPEQDPASCPCVPQGSVLGPILYTLFTADIPVFERDDLVIATYADDTAFLATSTDNVEASAILQLQLTKLEPWLLRWNIVVNENKSAHITFA